MKYTHRTYQVLIIGFRHTHTWSNPHFFVFYCTVIDEMVAMMLTGVPHIPHSLIPPCGQSGSEGERERVAGRLAQVCLLTFACCFCRCYEKTAFSSSFSSRVTVVVVVSGSWRDCCRVELLLPPLVRSCCCYCCFTCCSCQALASVAPSFVLSATAGSIGLARSGRQQVVAFWAMGASVHM